jgi:hypothetical protein
MIGNASEGVKESATAWQAASASRGDWSASVSQDGDFFTGSQRFLGGAPPDHTDMKHQTSPYVARNIT